jgi:hypothetical protein
LGMTDSFAHLTINVVNDGGKSRPVLANSFATMFAIT